MDFDDAENCQLSSRLCKWTMTLDLSRDKPAIRCETEKYGYTSVCAKNPPMIKLDGIQLESKRNSTLGVFLELELCTFWFCSTKAL